MSRRSRRNRQRSSAPATTPQHPGRNPQMATLSYTARMDISESIPPPSMLGDYNHALENGAERVMRLAERQQAHRHELENRVIDSDIRKSHIGLWCGAGIILVAIVCGTWLVSQGHSAQGLFIGVAALATGLGSLIWGYRDRIRQINEIRSGRKSNRLRP